MLKTAALAAAVALAAPALAMSLVPRAQDCTVTAEIFGHQPVPLPPDARLTLVPDGPGFRLTWQELAVDLVWQVIPEAGPLPLSGTDRLGMRYDASLGPDGSFIMVGRPGGIEYGLFATCAHAPR